MANSSLTDPFDQVVTLYTAKGIAIQIPLQQLNEYVNFNLKICINYGSQIGASLILLVVLLLLTKPDKRGAPIFITNVLSLVLNFIRNILNCLYYTGPFSYVYAWFAADYSRVTGKDFGISIAATVMTVLLLISIESSLLLQIQVVCCTLPVFYRWVIVTTSALVAALAVGFRLALCVENSKYTLATTYELPLAWLENASNITTTISICWFSAAFVTKLAFALNQRRKLGLDQFGPMQTIFIMGFQTLVIPAIFSILPYLIDDPGMSSQTLTLVSIFLPLSSLWASAIIKNRSQASIGMNLRPKLFNSSHSQRSSGPLSPADTARSGISSATLASPNQHYDPDTLYRDLEAQGLDKNHTY